MFSIERQYKRKLQEAFSKRMGRPPRWLGNQTSLRETFGEKKVELFLSDLSGAFGVKIPRDQREDLNDLKAVKAWVRYAGGLQYAFQQYFQTNPSKTPQT